MSLKKNELEYESKRTETVLARLCPITDYHQCSAQNQERSVNLFDLQFDPLLPQLYCSTWKFNPDSMLWMVLNYVGVVNKMSVNRTLDEHELWVKWCNRQDFPVPASPVRANVVELSWRIKQAINTNNNVLHQKICKYKFKTKISKHVMIWHHMFLEVPLLPRRIHVKA